MFQIPHRFALEVSTRMYRQDTAGKMGPNHEPYDSTTASFDEFAHPEMKQFRKEPPLREKFTRFFSDMPVFPVGMAGFCSMAAYGKVRISKISAASCAGWH